MRKILNWTGGGIFRTLGRFLAYLLVGGLLLLISQKLPIKLTSLLGIQKVNAAVLESWSVNQNRYRYDNRGTLTYSSWVNSPYTWEPNLPVDKVQYRMQATDGLSVENTYILEFGFRPNPDSLGVKTVNIFTNVNGTVYEDITCGNWNKNSNDYYLIKCSFTPLDNISSSTYLYAEVNFYESYQTSFRPYMYGFEERKGINSVVTEQTNNIINNNNSNTNKIINGLNGLEDTLTDDTAPDISSLNDMAGWLPAGPLDSILNLPLTLLNSLTTALSGVCTSITLTLPYINEDLTLPCISSIYQQIGAISFVNWVGTIASAFILFKYFMALYKWVDDTLTFRENNWLDNWGGVD